MALKYFKNHHSSVSELKLVNFANSMKDEYIRD